MEPIFVTLNLGNCCVTATLHKDYLVLRATDFVAAGGAIVPERPPPEEPEPTAQQRQPPPPPPRRRAPAAEAPSPPPPAKHHSGNANRQVHHNRHRPSEALKPRWPSTATAAKPSRKQKVAPRSQEACHLRPRAARAWLALSRCLLGGLRRAAGCSLCPGRNFAQGFCILSHVCLRLACPLSAARARASVFALVPLRVCEHCTPLLPAARSACTVPFSAEVFSLRI